MRKHDLTWPDQKTMTKTKTNTKTMTNTFREHLQRAIFEVIKRTPSNGNFREVLSLSIDSLFQTKMMGVDQILQISQSWNTWNTWNTWSWGSFAIFAMFLIWDERFVTAWCSHPFHLRHFPQSNSQSQQQDLPILPKILAKQCEPANLHKISLKPPLLLQ